MARQSGCDERVNPHAFGFQVIIDDFQHRLAQPLVFDQLAGLADRQLIRGRAITKVNAHEGPRRCAGIGAVFGLRVRHVEPLLQKADAQHTLNPNRWAPALPRRVMRFNQGRERGPRNHNVHLRQEALSSRLRVVAVKAEAEEAFFAACEVTRNKREAA